jgi:hypothetical protein
LIFALAKLGDRAHYAAKHKLENGLMNPRYIPDLSYTALIEALLALKPAKAREQVTFDQIAMALGQIGNIWPMGMMK